VYAWLILIERMAIIGRPVTLHEVYRTPDRRADERGRPVRVTDTPVECRRHAG
jgi:hypothetical protein